MFPVKVKKFEGPLELLLGLLEREELDITQVSLAAVTEQYLAHLGTVAKRNPDELADFLVVAAKLLLLKSRVLLPNIVWEEEADDDLERQLKMYREYFEAATRIEALIAEARFTFFRPRPPFADLKGFYPPKKLSASMLREAFVAVLHRLEPIVRLPETRIKETVSIEEKIESIRRTIAAQVHLNFKTLLQGATSRTDVIVNYLALLELIKQRVVAVRQSNTFDDILIESAVQTP